MSQRKDPDRAAPPTSEGAPAPAGSAAGAVDAFLGEVARIPVRASAGKGRLMFIMDATLSRQPTWDQACALQGELFLEADAIGGLDVKLVYFRGWRECRASRWAGDAQTLLGLMQRVDCRGGRTQIGRALDHALRERRNGRLDAIVYVGDCCEESGDLLCDQAARLGAEGAPIFLFHEGGDRRAGQVFRAMANASGGAYAPFDASSAAQLHALLRAVAAFAAGGRAALEDRARDYGRDAVKLLEQLR